jgi:uncharacterized membrane protein
MGVDHLGRLFGILLISLSLLTSAIILQISMVFGEGPPSMTIVFIVIVFVIGISMLFTVSRNKSEEVEYVSNEEIEAELLNENKKDTE